MKKTHFSKPSLLYVLCLCCCFGSNCSGQEPQTPTKTENASSYIPKTHPEQSKPISRVVVHEGEDIYEFYDSKGDRIGHVTWVELTDKNPYSKNTLPTKKPAGEDFYNRFKGLIPGEIRKQLPKNLRTTPSDDILKRAGVIKTTLTSVGYNPENPQYIVVSYALEIYDKHSLEETWVETTIHVYDNRGKIISTIVDNHNIQGTYISSDGKYILANEIFARIGDGVSEDYMGLVVYDVQKRKFVAAIKNKFMDIVDNFLSVKSGKFGFWGSHKDRLVDGGISDHIWAKYIIDISQRAVYYKDYNLIDKPKVAVPDGRTLFDLEGEDLSTYKVFYF